THKKSFGNSYGRPAAQHRNQQSDQVKKLPFYKQNQTGKNRSGDQCLKRTEASIQKQHFTKPGFAPGKKPKRNFTIEAFHALRILNDFYQFGKQHYVQPYQKQHHGKRQSEKMLHAETVLQKMVKSRIMLP